MKKHLIALAVFAASGLAMAQNSATSTVTGGTQSISVTNGSNQYSNHGAGAYSQNSSSAQGGAVGGVSVLGIVANPYSATGAAATETSGSTITGAYGIGTGTAEAGATQFGTASSEHSADALATVGLFQAPAVVGGIEVTSGSTVGTQSTATVGNFGVALSGTNASAQNATVAAVNSAGPGTTNATGASLGNAVSNTWGFSLSGAQTASGNLTGPMIPAGTGAISGGTYGGSVTRP